MEQNSNEYIVEYISGLVAASRKAQKTFERNYKTQRAIDEVVRAAGKGVVDHAMELAAGAVSETGMGNMEGKAGKLNSVALRQWNTMRGRQTVGYMPVEGEPGVRMMCKPLGVIGCVMPSTNPLATVVGNSMMALKCRNSVIIAPHPGSAQSSWNTVELIRKALKEIGAPEDLVMCIEPGKASIEATNELLRQCDCNIATGGAGMVKSVYSAGRPAFGVGQGNCQVLVDRDQQDYAYMCECIIHNRSLDLGVPCTGEQTVHVPEERLDDFLTAMQAIGAFLVSDKETVDKIRDLVFPGGGPLNRKITGRTPQQIGAMIGLEVPESARVLLLPNQARGTEDSLCREILCPMVRYTTYKTFEEAVDSAIANLECEGAGHSSSIWSDDEAHIEYAADLIPVGRFHIKQPTGGRNNGIPSTITIGCGSWGNNSICENLQYYHLMNKTRVTVSLPNFRPMTMDDWDSFDVCSRVTD